MTDRSSSDCDNPSPANFVAYFPWACKQLERDVDLLVTKVYQNEYTSSAMTERTRKGRSRAKLTHSQSQLNDFQDKDKDNLSASSEMEKIFAKATTPVVKVLAIYDNVDHLVQIKFEKNTQLPQIVMKILGLIIHFYHFLFAITIVGGLDELSVYEISKFLPSTHITDICLDNCYLKSPNYHILLENAIFLKHLSLCRCKIDDMAIENIFNQLIYPLPASKTLCILNLSSNMITDKGAKFIARALRSNRQLYYLNVASNMLTDTGAIVLLNILKEFPLTAEESFEAKVRLMTYLRTKNQMIADTIKDLRLGDADKKSSKRKPRQSALNMDGLLIDKAMAIVDQALGPFEEAFSTTNTCVRNGVTYCKGNNTLCSLNLSFNSLGYFTLKSLESVLVYQDLLDRKPRGLVTVSVEGNHMPVVCRELVQIDDLVDLNLQLKTRRQSAHKNRSALKTTPR